MIIFRLSMCVIALFMFAGCAQKSLNIDYDSASTSAPQPNPVVVSPSPGISINRPIADSLYIDTTRFGQEPDGFAVYTYVLLRRGASTSAVRKKAALVNAIKDLSYGNVLDGLPSGGSANNYNLFVIPAESLNNQSMPLLNALAEKQPRFLGEGPFLVTLSFKLNGQPPSNDEYMFVDFSKLNIHSVRYVVNEYKKHEFKPSLSPGQKTNTFKVYLLSTIFYLKDSIEAGTAAHELLSKTLQ